MEESLITQTQIEILRLQRRRIKMCKKNEKEYFSIQFELILCGFLCMYSGMLYKTLTIISRYFIRFQFQSKSQTKNHIAFDSMSTSILVGRRPIR